MAKTSVVWFARSLASPIVVATCARVARAARCLAWVGCLSVTSAACAEPQTREPDRNEPSPNASILPAPLASAVERPSKADFADAGRVPDAEAVLVEPRYLREDRALQPDSALRDAPAVRMVAEFRWQDLPPVPRLPESNLELTQRLRDTLTFSLAIDLSSTGRLRAAFTSELFPFPRGTELRARSDYFGHLLVFNAGQSYTPVGPGTLRALVNEHRADAAPLTKPKILELGTGTLFGLSIQKRELSTPLGRLILEQAQVANSGLGAALLCRLLSELIAAEPANAACSVRELPVRAELHSSGGGKLLFEVKKLQRDAEIDPESLLCPPPEARFAPGEMLPGHASAVVPQAERLRELRLRPTTRTERPEPAAPKHGLLIQNRTESLRYVLLDGVVLARVLPRREVHVEALLAGKYALASLDFFGDEPTPLRIVELPARVALGEDVEPER